MATAAEDPAKKDQIGIFFNFLLMFRYENDFLCVFISGFTSSIPSISPVPQRINYRWTTMRKNAGLTRDPKSFKLHIFTIHFISWQIKCYHCKKCGRKCVWRLFFFIWNVIKFMIFSFFLSKLPLEVMQKDFQWFSAWVEKENEKIEVNWIFGE